MITLEEFGTALQFLRKKRGLQQQDIERETGMPRGTLSRYEAGRQGPSFKRLLQILDALNASFGDLDRAVRMARDEPAEAPPAQVPPPAAPEERPERDSDRRPQHILGLPAEIVGRELHNVLATMVRETLRDDPQGVVDAMRAASETPKIRDD